MLMQVTVSYLTILLGLTYVARTAVSPDLQDLEELLVKQFEASAARIHEDGGPDEILTRHAAEAVRSGDRQKISDYVHCCNAHIFGTDETDEGKAQRARCLHYLDIVVSNYK